MTLILLAIALLILTSGGLIWWSGGGYRTVHDIAMIIAAFGMILAFCAVAVYVKVGFDWLAAEHKTAILNREYGTHYTQAEIFYASDVIDTIRNLDRRRYELNGNLLGDKLAK